MDSDESPQGNQHLHSVVIITLPPPDNPSLGKTITAFTLNNDHFSHRNYDHNHHHEQQRGHDRVPVESHPQSLQNPGYSSSFSSPKTVLGFLVVSLFAIALYGSVISHTIRDFDEGKDDDNQRPASFVFLLYRKSNVGDSELKLGRFLDLKGRNSVKPYGPEVVKPQNFNRLVSTDAAIDSSAIFPARSKVYPDGLYYTYMLVGDPPKPYYLDIDTGSDLTWVQCDAPCISCAKGANSLYRPERGSIVPLKDPLCAEVQRKQKAPHCETCQQCDYEIEYADLSSSMGVLARDKLHLMFPNGSSTMLDVAFGCGYDQRGILLKTLAETDGVLGLSQAKVSLPSQLASQGIINNVVGHCLTGDGEGSGYIFLGDDFVPQRGMAWVSMSKVPSIDFYHTEFTRMNYGSSPLRLGGQNGGPRRVVFDSGSSYTYFTKQAYSELIKSLEPGFTRDATDTTLPICWQAGFPIRSVMEIKQFFKTITLQLGSKWWIISKKLQIPPEGYLIISNKGNVCLGILDGSQVHDGSSIILGDISLHGQLIVYDNVKRRIGWAKSDCVKPKAF